MSDIDFAIDQMSKLIGDGKLEESLVGTELWQLPICSAAISLKRIADALDSMLADGEQQSLELSPRDKADLQRAVDAGAVPGPGPLEALELPRPKPHETAKAYHRRVMRALGR